MALAFVGLRVLAFFTAVALAGGETEEIPDCSDDLEWNAIPEKIRNFLGGLIINAMRPDHNATYNCFLEGYALYLFEETYFVHRTFNNTNVTKLIHQE
ncbi:hypothetical protein Y032_0233g3074 [Ancylostoma ceylanicum]|uniref:Uncharacterized protein n=1 Tax=Ancylostoma ceylanicum TaxID=53326 RepID=A0A016SFV7_9BILA|nr:hypothetical protein Y032_0233g3074 [Ancylostoma ceylanicum]